MTTKALFLAAQGDPNQPFGQPIELTTFTDNIFLSKNFGAIPHGQGTGAGPFKLLNSANDAPSMLTAARHASTFMTGTAMIAGDKITVNGQEYTLDAAPNAEDEVDLGASDAETLINLAAAINQDTPGGVSSYDPETQPNTEVKAVVTSANRIDFIARTLDPVLGNAITVSTLDPSRMVLDNPTFQGGIAGTDYFIISLNPTTLVVALTRENAFLGEPPLGITDFIPPLGEVRWDNDGSGINSLVATMQSHADSMEDVLINVLTRHGNRSQPAAFNQARFWQTLIDGSVATEL